VALIPKKPWPGSILDYRPISLCNVVYKLVTKVISNRLKPLPPSIIFDTQSAFTEGRLITDNILITFEIFHATKCDGRSNGDMAVKLDMAKAFDRVRWPFLSAIMLRLGFRCHWVELIMPCVESASFSFLVNGVPRGHVILS